MNDCEIVSDEVGEQNQERENVDFSANFEREGKDLDDEQDKFEDVVMPMSIWGNQFVGVQIPKVYFVEIRVSKVRIQQSKYLNSNKIVQKITNILAN